MKPFAKMVSTEATSVTQEKYDYELFSAICSPIILLGVLSNLFFFVSITYALKKNNHGFGEEMWKWILLLNLSMADFLFCLFLWMNWLVGLVNNPGTPPALCKFLVLFRLDLSLVDGWLIAIFTFNATFPRLL